MDQLCGVPGKPAVPNGATLSRLEALFASDIWREGWLRGREEVFQRFEVIQANGEYGRRQVIGVPSGVNDAPATDARGTRESWNDAGNASTYCRNRAHRRYYRRPRAGIG